MYAYACVLVIYKPFLRIVNNSHHDPLIVGETHCSVCCCGIRGDSALASRGESFTDDSKITGDTSTHAQGTDLGGG